PPFRPDASHPTIPASRTSTSTPARASHHAALSPVTPPPTTTTEAPRGSVIGVSLHRGSARHVQRDGHVRIAGPGRRDLRRDAEPAHPVLAHRGQLVLRPED